MSGSIGSRPVPMMWIMERAASRPAPARTPRWSGAGHSRDRDPELAGRNAALEAVGGRPDAALLLVFAPCGADLHAVLAGVGSVAGDAPVAGMAGGGQLAAEGAFEDAVVVVALGGDDLQVSLSVGVEETPRDAGAVAAAAVGDLDTPHRALLLLADDSVDDHVEVARGAYSVAGAGIPIAGGLSGPAGAVLCGRGVHRSAALGIALGSKDPIGIGFGHGLEAVGEPMLATRVSGARLLELDGRPAIEVLAERLGRKLAPGAENAQPLGLHRHDDRWQVRCAMADERTERDGSLRCLVPEGAPLWVMEGSRETALAATDAACGHALAALSGAKPRALLLFDCVARSAALGEDGLAREVACATRWADGAAVAGVLTVGEFARTVGPAGLHHSTIVAVAIA